jgi:hypothetical protein
MMVISYELSPQCWIIISFAALGLISYNVFENKWITVVKAHFRVFTQIPKGLFGVLLVHLW